MKSLKPLRMFKEDLHEKSDAELMALRHMQEVANNKNQTIKALSQFIKQNQESIASRTQQSRSAMSMINEHNFIGKMHQSKKQAESELQMCEQQVATQQSKWQACMRREESVGHIIDKRVEEAAIKQQAQEQKQSDELAGLNALRKKQSSLGKASFFASNAASMADDALVETAKEFQSLKTTEEEIPSARFLTRSSGK